MIDSVAGTIGSAVLLLGLLVATIGLYGMLRHPDIFEQLHAAGLVTGPAVIMILFAALASGSAEIITSAFLVAAFMLVTSSLSTHVVALAAWERRNASGQAGAAGLAEASATDGRTPAAMRVLLAYDGSPSSNVALALTESLTWPDGSLVRVVSVTKGDLAPVEDMAVPRATTDRQSDRSSATSRAAARGLERPGLTVEHLQLGGDPASAILDQADAIRADLVVMGSRGLGPVRSMVTGSVASGVLDGAPCPVLVARTSRSRYVLLATDGSRASIGATDVIARWPIFDETEVKVLSVATLAPQYRELPPTRAQRQGAATSRHREIAVAAANTLKGAGRRAIPFVRTGDEASQIVHFAEARSVDLIVLGSRGHTGLKRTLLGSVARDVLASTPTSVLVVRSPDQG